MEGYKLVIFANSIFGENKKGAVRKVDFEIQQYGISLRKCRYCDGNEVSERYFISQEFISSNKYLYIDLIQLSYPSSPRGAHSIIVNEGDYYNSGMNSSLPNTYKGWGGHPGNLYIPIWGRMFAIDEISDIKVIAVREEVETKNIKNYIASIEAGKAGNWNFYINIDFEKKQIEPELFGHPSCIKKKKFSELEQSDIYRGLSRDCFQKIAYPNIVSHYKAIYVCNDGSEVLYDYEIYKVHRTDKGNMVFLKNDFTGLDENYEPVYWDRDSSDRVRVYYEPNYERGINFDYAIEVVLEKREESENERTEIVEC